MMAQADAESPMLRAALHYAARGRPVFPCGDNKQPLTRSGFKDATTDEGVIRQWWQRWPRALIGMPTGRVSGVIVIDLDVREGYDGADALRNLEDAYGELPETITALTAGGGQHLYWKYPGWDVRNSASKLGLGIDVRGDGGYVIVPPSRMADGRAYEWEASNPDGMAELPVWALRLLGARVEPRSVSELQMQQGAQAGKRNVYLASLAGRLAHAGLSREQIKTMVLAENARACDPPLDADEIERTVMKSATKWVMAAAGEGVNQAAESPETASALRWYRASEWVADLRAPDWLIDGVIERGTLTAVIGGWGGGKSAVLLDLFCRMALGLPWHGIPLEAAPVVYVVGEGQRGFQRRIAAWCAHHGHPWPENLIVIPEAVLIGKPDHEAALSQALAEIAEEYGQQPAAVALDTLARCFGLEDENSSADMMAWSNSISTHIIAPTGAAVVALHHPGHGDKTRGRGSSALPGAVDNDMLIQRTGNRVQLTINKAKDGDTAQAWAWRLLGVNLELPDVHGEVTNVSVVTVEEEQPVSDERPALAFGSKEEAAWQTLVEMYDEAVANMREQGRPDHEAHVDRPAWRVRCESLGIVKSRQQWHSLIKQLEQKEAIDTSQEPWIYPAGWQPVPF